jgi:predicted nucleic acid-binding protein
MIFQDVPGDATVFVDANTVVYAIVGHALFGAASKALLDRVEKQDIKGISSTHVLSEIVHRLMTIEACDRFGWPAKGIASRLRRHPKEIQQLLVPRRAVDEIVAARIDILAVTVQQVSEAVDLSQQLGLLSADALVVAFMRAQGIVNLASNDSDFDCVPSITRFAPV